MKHIKKILLLIATIWLFLFSINSTFAEDHPYYIKWIDAISDNQIEVSLTKDLNLPWDNIYSDMKIYQDIPNIESYLDLNDAKKVHVVLDTPLMKSTTYSIISVVWPEWNSKIELGESMNNIELENELLLENEYQWIKKIILKDEYNFEVHFISNIEKSDELEFNFYKNIWIAALFKSDAPNTIDVLIDDKLQDNSEYIATISEIDCECWTVVSIKNWIVDFTYRTRTEEELLRNELHKESLKKSEDSKNQYNESYTESPTETYYTEEPYIEAIYLLFPKAKLYKWYSIIMHNFL